jgi:hypothetical protein
MIQVKSCLVLANAFILMKPINNCENKTLTDLGLKLI